MANERFTKRLTRLFRREAPADADKPADEQAPEELPIEAQVAHMSADEAKKILLEKLAELDSLKAEHEKQLIEAGVEARKRSLDSFDKVLGPRSEEHLQRLRESLENLITKSQIDRTAGHLILRDVKYCMGTAAQFPRFQTNTARELEKLKNAQIREADARHRLELAQKDLIVYRNSKILTKIVDGLLEVVSNCKGVVTLKQVSDGALAHYEGRPVPEQEERTLRASAILTILEDMLKANENFFVGLKDAVREGDDASAKYNLILDHLAALSPEKIAELKERLAKADDLKRKEDRPQKGQAGVPAERRESYDNIIKELLPQAVTSRALVKGLFDFLFEQFPREQAALSKFYEAENMFAIDQRTAAYVKDKIAQMKNMLADFEGDLTDLRKVIYSEVAQAIGEEPDEKRIAEKPADYVSQALNQLQSRTAALAGQVSPQVDPAALVRQAYVHQLLGDAYSAEKDSVNADAQYNKAKILCESAKSLAADSNRGTIETEIAKFEEFTKRAENE